MLAGTGNVTGIFDELLGLLGPGSGVGQISGAGPLTDYLPFLDGLGALMQSNDAEKPAWIMNPTTAIGLAKLATGITGDRTQLQMPVPLAEVPRL